MAFTGSNWVPIGTPGFASAPVISLALHPSFGNPYLAFSGSNNNLMVTLMAYNGTGWATVGAPSFSASSVETLSLKLDRSGVPYVACQGYYYRQAIVWVYNGTWKPVGSDNRGFSMGTVDSISLALHPSTALPYVAYSEGSLAGRATIKAYNGSSWVVVGGPGLSTGEASSISLALHPVTGAAVLAYHDSTDGNVVYSANASGGWIQLGPGSWSPGLWDPCRWTIVCQVVWLDDRAHICTPLRRLTWNGRQPITASNHRASLRCGNRIKQRVFF